MAVLKCTRCLQNTHWTGDWDHEDWQCSYCGKLHTYVRNHKSNGAEKTRNAVDSLHMAPENMRKLKVRGVYRHFRNGLEYRVLEMGCLESNLEEYVLYQAQYGEKKKWIRPLNEFLGQVEHAGTLVNRFEYVR